MAGVLIGFVLIIGCVAALAWNEGRAVKTERGLKEGAAAVIDVQATPISADNEQKLVHVSGPVVVTDPLEDSEFGVTATGVHLARKVEMYQWRETSKEEKRTKLGGGEETVTTYTYAKAWSGSAEDSSEFAEPNGHQNPEFAIEGADILAQDATLGDFQLDEDVVGQIGGAAPLRLTQDNLNAVKAAVGQGGHYVSIARNTILLSAERPRSTDVDDADDAEPLSEATTTTSTNPSIGDVRISYELTPARVISVVARQNDDGFLPYSARNGEEFLLVADGALPAADMFKGAQDENRIMTWIIRVIGLVLLITGFGLILAPLGVLADVLPLAGTVVRMGTGLIALVLGLIVGVITIALAWFAFRPLLSVGLLVVGGLIAFGVYRLARSRNAAKLAEAAA